ncbi:hypothetical protein ADK38_42400, partial [Streptomyces varsoviensis]
MPPAATRRSIVGSSVTGRTRPRVGHRGAPARVRTPARFRTLARVRTPGPVRALTRARFLAPARTLVAPARVSLLGGRGLLIGVRLRTYGRRGAVIGVAFGVVTAG